MKDYTWDAVQYLSESTALAVTGPADTFLSATTDGGTTWKPVAVNGLAPGAAFTAPIRDGSLLLLGGITNHDDGSQTIQIFGTSDGIDFKPMGAAVQIPSESATPAPILAAFGNSYWLFGSNGSLFQTTDGAMNWKAVKSSALPAGVTEASLSSASDGVVVASNGMCDNSKTNCAVTTQTATTTDSGVTWTAVP